MKNMLISTLAGLLLAASSVSVNADHHGAHAPDPEVYKIDPVHSGVSFRIRHFFNRVPGSFKNFGGTLYVHRGDMSKNRVTATIEVGSVDTANADRDAHLQNDDFFDAPKYPEITFASTEWKQTGENTFKVTGDLTMLDITRPVTLDVELLGFGQGRGDTYLSGWTATTTIDRRDWGITYGRPAVGDTVDIVLDVQAHRQN